MAVKVKIKIKEKQLSSPISGEPMGGLGNDNAALRAAKQGAKAKVKSEFKFKIAEAKSSMPKKEAKFVISEEKDKYKAAKKEIRKYTDY